MKRVVQLVILLVFMISSFSLHALPKAPSAKSQSLVAMLKLTNLEAVKLQERHGDELFFDILAYPDTGSPAHSLVPPKPHYWLNVMLNKVKDVLLWQGEIKEGHKVILIVSLMEHDSPPWDNNDLLGSFKLALINANGKLMYRVGRMDKELNSIQSVSNPITAMDFMTSFAHYRASFAAVPMAKGLSYPHRTRQY